MELNWSTFLLEIINFLILVWLLKHFFYKPVLDVIRRRRTAIEKVLSDAEKKHADAEVLHDQFENRLAEWEKERQTAYTELEKEIQAEHSRRMEALHAALEQETEKNRVIVQHKIDAERLHTEELALNQGARFASRLLSVAAGPEMEKRLIDLLLKDLSTLPDEKKNSLRTAADNSVDIVMISSAYPLDDDTQRKLEKSLAANLNVNLPVQYVHDKDLQAGLRITIGDWVLHANLQDELKSFVDIAHEK